jgi:hypothetical protein
MRGLRRNPRSLGREDVNWKGEGVVSSSMYTIRQDPTGIYSVTTARMLSAFVRPIRASAVTADKRK